MTAAVTHTNLATTNNKSGMDTSSTATATIAPQDVGLLFVREYYTFLNKKPVRLPAFYNKDSYFVRGDEGEAVQTYHGQEEIRQKIEELNFEDCKVLVTQLDSQASAGNGILIQVLGEMCVMDGPSQKFSQTFFLAPQPNGYYVLNDIFRFLKDEVDIDYYTCEDDQQQQQAVNKKADVVIAEQQQEEVKKEQQLESALPVKEQQQPPATAPITPQHQQTEEPKAPVAEKLVAEQTPAVVVEPKIDEKKKKPAKDDATKGINGTTEVKKSDKQKQQQSTNKTAEKTAASPKPAPAAPRSWANLAANDSSKWGTQVSEAKGSVSSTPPPPPNTTPSTQPQPQQPSTPAATPNKESTPQTTGQPQTPQNTKEQPRKDEVTHIFVKNVHSGLTEDQISEAFTKFGAIKTLNIVNHRNCAFVEFQSPEACQKALAQHKVTIGQSVVLAEERRPFRPGGNMNRQQQQQQQQQNGNANFERRQQNYRRGGGSGNSNATGGGRGTNTVNKSRSAGNTQK